MPKPLDQRLAEELSISAAQVRATIALLDEGATVPFIARYRKEVTNGLDDTQLRDLAERLVYLRELDARRNAILEAISEQGKLDSALAASIDSADTKQRLEDLYAPYKKKRRTKAQIAREAGLDALAESLLADPTLAPQAEAQAYLKAPFTTPDGDNPGVADVKAALDGARQVLIERFAENADLVGQPARALRARADHRVQVVPGKETEGEKFADYFDHRRKARRDSRRTARSPCCADAANRCCACRCNCPMIRCPPRDAAGARRRSPARTASTISSARPTSGCSIARAGPGR